MATRPAKSSTFSSPSRTAITPKELAGKPVVFKIKLIDVCVRQIPALNSDFAKKVANVDTLDELRAQVKQQLHDGKHASALNRAKDQILTQLSDAAEGELPSVLVENTYQLQMEQIQQQLQMQRTESGPLPEPDPRDP